MKRRNRIDGQFSPRLVEMLDSSAYRVLSLSAHRVISRIEIEHAEHGGCDNGNLPVTKQDFIDYGIHHDAVAPAIREAEALGFIRMKRGRGGNADHRQPNKFFLTFAQGRDSRAYPPTHEWRKIKTIEEAQAIADAARAKKDPRAVQFGKARKTKHRSRKPGPKPVPETGTENPTSPVPETGTTGKGRKPGPLSISRGGGRGQRAVSSAAASASPAAAAAWIPYRERGLDERHSREGLMAYVANVIEEQLQDLDPSRVRARQRAQARARELSRFDPVGGKIWNELSGQPSRERAREGNGPSIREMKLRRRNRWSNKMANGDDDPLQVLDFSDFLREGINLNAAPALALISRVVSGRALGVTMTAGTADRRSHLSPRGGSLQ